MKEFLAFCFFLFGGVALIWWVDEPLRQSGPGEAIQGIYSHLNCDTQPGKYPWYEAVLTVDADGNESEFIYFLGCR
jgi:hypothetical protein